MGQNAVGLRQAHTAAARSLKNVQLVSERENLEVQRGSRAHGHSHGVKKRRQERQHRPKHIGERQYPQSWQLLRSFRYAQVFGGTRLRLAAYAACNGDSVLILFSLDASYQAAALRPTASSSWSRSLTTRW